MASPPLRLCLSCQTSLETNDPAVFRDGVKIAHVRAGGSSTCLLRRPKSQTQFLGTGTAPLQPSPDPADGGIQ
jgi:hypothetical protein